MPGWWIHVTDVECTWHACLFINHMSGNSITVAPNVVSNQCNSHPIPMPYLWWWNRVHICGPFIMVVTYTCCFMVLCHFVMVESFGIIIVASPHVFFASAIVLEVGDGISMIVESYLRTYLLYDRGFRLKSTCAVWESHITGILSLRCILVKPHPLLWFRVNLLWTYYKHELWWLNSLGHN